MTLFLRMCISTCVRGVPKDVDEYRAARNKTETLFKNCFNNLFAAIGGIFPMVDVVVTEKIIVALA